MITAKINIKLDTPQDIIQKKGLEPGGRVQMILADELVARGERRTPKQEDFLINSVRFALSGGQEIYYPGPYARYLWYGKVMKGKAPMQPTDKPLQYQEAPLRGKEWLIRTWQDEKIAILQTIARETGMKVE